jgi:hypothetical protein
MPLTRYAIVLVVAGCIGEPAPPPGGNNELRRTTLVANLRNGQFDDLVVLGHDGDPRENATMRVYFGGGTALAAPQRIALAYDDPADPHPVWYEPLAVADFQHGTSTGYELAVMTAQDDDWRPVSDHRRVTATRYPITSGMVGETPVVRYSSVAAPHLGGYATANGIAFVATRDDNVTANGTETVFGGAEGVWWSDGVAPKPATFSPIDQQAVIGVVATRPSVEGPTMGHERLLVSTTEGVYRTVEGALGPNYTVEPVGMDPLFADNGLHQLSYRQVQTSELWLAATNPTHFALVTLVDYDPNSSTLVTNDVATRSAVVDLGVYDVNLPHRLDLVTIEGATLNVYPQLISDQANRLISPLFEPLQLALPDSNYDMLAIGHFLDTVSGDDQILVVDHSDPRREILCFEIINGMLEQSC